MDCIWYNPEGLPRPEGLNITHEISNIKDIMEILL